MEKQNINIPITPYDILGMGDSDMKALIDKYRHEGVYMPLSVMFDTSITPNAKAVYAAIVFFSQGLSYTLITNTIISHCVGVSGNRISRLISELCTAKLIEKGSLTWNGHELRTLKPVAPIKAA